jgi:hypothetical protein
MVLETLVIIINFFGPTASRRSGGANLPFGHFLKLWAVNIVVINWNDRLSKRGFGS